MPKVPMYTLTWSSARETYELYQTLDREALRIVPDSSEWYAWLEQVPSFAFVGQRGHYTARKEAKRRGSRYWYAYLARGTQLTKKYLGKTADLNLTRLEQIAGLLSAIQAPDVQPRQEKPFQPAQSENQTLPPVSPAAGVDSKIEAASPSLLAGQRTPLHPLLATKLHVPHPRTHLVARPHLVERLQQGIASALTLVSAPAGFGKTTLLAQWFAQSGTPVAWLSLEAEDNDPTRFLSYLIAALQTFDAQLGTTALALLRMPQSAVPEAVLAVLVSEVAGRDTGDFTIVLEDYHVISAESIQRGMTFLLEHLPPQMHLILATRADPPLPLARLRAQGQLTEVRTADLRFGAAEAGTFLQTVMGLDLPPEAIITLQNRTEGWIAGLQLAALSLQGRTDVSTFLAAFGGSYRFVLDYLSEEVLARQDGSVQQFLLHTSILDRLSGPLCDALMEQEGSQAMLETLERANLFVVPLDEERGWYRYHHLFAEVLRSHLQQIEPTLVSGLHRRASAWYEQQELLIEAVQHALAVPDVEHAARLIESIALPVTLYGQISTVLRWMNALPEALVRTRPFLCVYHASLLAVTNQLDAAKARLREAEQYALKESPAELARTIQGWVLATRAGIVGLSGDIADSVSLAHQALELLPETEIIPRAAATFAAAHAYEVTGDVTHASEREVAAVAALVRAADNPFGAVSNICLLARLHVLRGRLQRAAATYAQVVQAVPRPEILQTLFTSLPYYFGLGDLLRERNELEAAEQHLVQGMVLVKEAVAVEPLAAIVGYTALARLQQARGNSREALAVLDRLVQLTEQRHFAPYLMTQEAAVRARLELVQGDVAAAIHWADNSGLSTGDEDLPYSHEGEYLTLARVRIAQGGDDPAAPFLQDVLHLLERLLREAEAKARLGSMLEIFVLRALALEAQGDQMNALSTLERALMLAAPEGYIRLFVDEGEAMLALLRQAYAHGIASDYVATLIAAFGEQHALDLPPLSPRQGTLTEPLTEREREVLRLLLEGASNREIARHLVLSVNTVKRHVYNLCGKLGVQSRTQAIARARTLNLL